MLLFLVLLAQLVTLLIIAMVVNTPSTCNENLYMILLIIQNLKNYKVKIDHMVIIALEDSNNASYAPFQLVRH